MKYYLVLISLFIGLNISAQGLGIRFHATTWEDAAKLATKNKKIIFVDAYTDWCAPCKVMEEHVFTHEWAGDYFNQNFINLKMNMEKGQGPLFVARYGIETYPCFLFISSDGTLVYKVESYMNVERLIREAKIGAQPYLYTKAMDDRFNDGDRQPRFLFNYLYLKKENDDESYKTIIPMYLSSQKDWSDENAAHLIFEFVDQVDSDMFKYIANNKARYQEIIGEEKLNEKYSGLIDKALKNNDQPLSLEKRAKIITIAYPSQAEQMIVDYELDYYEKNGPENIYAKKAFTYYTTTEKNNPKKIRTLIPLFKKHLSSSEAKAFVKSWTLKEASKDNSPSSWKKLAQYYLEEKNYSKAMEVAKKAYKMAKKEKLPKGSYKALLSKIKKAIKSA